MRDGSVYIGSRQQKEMKTKDISEDEKLHNAVMCTSTFNQDILMSEGQISFRCIQEIASSDNHNKNIVT